MPKRTSYKKSKKQRKSNNKTHYRKSKSHSKRVKGRGVANYSYSKPSYQCINNNLYQMAASIKLDDTKPVSEYFDQSTNTPYKCKNNILYEKGKAIIDDVSLRKNKFNCEGNNIMYNYMLYGKC